MVQAGIPASNHSFSSVISACAKAGKPDKAEIWLNHMEDHGIEPDVVAFSSIIDACSKADDAERAERIFRRMRNRGISPNIVAYSSLARPFARRGNWTKVEELEAELQMEGLRMNEYFLYTLLDSYCCAQPRQPERAERAFRRAVESGVKMNDYVKGQLFKILGPMVAQQVISDCRMRGGQDSGGAPARRTEPSARRAEKWS